MQRCNDKVLEVHGIQPWCVCFWGGSRVLVLVRFRALLHLDHNTRYCGSRLDSRCFVMSPDTSLPQVCPDSPTWPTPKPLCCAISPQLNKTTPPSPGCSCQFSGPPRPMESRWAVFFWFHDPAVVLADHRQPWIRSCKCPSAVGYGCQTSGTIMDLQTEPWWHVGLSANCVTMRNLFSNGLPSFSLVNLPSYGGISHFQAAPKTILHCWP